jgi:hypothetical protein
VQLYTTDLVTGCSFGSLKIFHPILSKLTMLLRCTTAAQFCSCLHLSAPTLNIPCSDYVARKDQNTGRMTKSAITGAHELQLVTGFETQFRLSRDLPCNSVQAHTTPLQAERQNAGQNLKRFFFFAARLQCSCLQLSTPYSFTTEQHCSCRKTCSKGSLKMHGICSSMLLEYMHWHASVHEYLENLKHDVCV